MVEYETNSVMCTKLSYCYKSESMSFTDQIATVG